jgi:hypothetical protein
MKETLYSGDVFLNNLGMKDYAVCQLNFLF